MENNYYPFVNQPLPYDYSALEPFIDEKTMHLHHDRHLQTYIDNLNGILEKEPKLQKLSLEQLIQISGRLPCRLQAPVRNNAGGVYNHRFFFPRHAPASPQSSRGNPDGAHPAAIREFGTVFGRISKRRPLRVRLRVRLAGVEPKRFENPHHPKSKLPRPAGAASHFSD